MDIRFYHLMRQSLREALPRLAEKVIAKGHRILVVSSNRPLLEDLDQSLWTYEDTSFLPHGFADMKGAERQPLLLASAVQNHNNADVLILLDGEDSAHMAEFAICLMMFDGRQNHIVEACRAHWKAYQAKGALLSYYQQTEAGGWQKKT